MLQMHLKLLQKDEFKKQQKQLVISLIIKLLVKLPTKTKRAPKSLQKYNSETNE